MIFLKIDKNKLFSACYISQHDIYIAYTCKICKADGFLNLKKRAYNKDGFKNTLYYTNHIYYLIWSSNNDKFLNMFQENFITGKQFRFKQRCFKIGYLLGINIVRFICIYNLATYQFLIQQSAFKSILVVCFPIF